MMLDGVAKPESKHGDCFSVPVTSLAAALSQLSIAVPVPLAVVLMSRYSSRATRAELEGVTSSSRGGGGAGKFKNSRDLFC